MKNIENTKNVTEDLTLNSVNTTLVNTAHKQHKFNLEAYNSEFKKDQIIPSLRFHTNSNVQNNTIERLSEIDVDCLPLDRYHNRLLKRAFDFSFSISFFLIIGWWLFPIIAILIKATTNGPVFFKQGRPGLDENEFFRASRKHIINLNWIEKVENWFNGGLRATLKTGEQIEISRRQAAKFKDILSL